MAKYDFLIVGAGLFGAAFAQRAAERGKKCLVLDRRKYVAGVAHCEEIEGVQVHHYGPHIFHTKDKQMWDYVNRFAPFRSYFHEPLICGLEGIFNLPFNMNTFVRLWGVTTPGGAREKLNSQTGWEAVAEPQNLEELCLKQYGRDLYEKFIKGCVEKEIGVSCREIPPGALQMPPARFTFDNRWFDDPWQGVPVEGYDVMVRRMLAACDLMLDTDYLPFIRVNQGIADRIIYTGAIDEFFRYKQGMLEYRAVRYENEVLDMPDYQGAAVIYYPEPAIPFLRVIEYKHFLPGNQKKTVIAKELPARWDTSIEPFFPAMDEKSRRIFTSYKMLAVAQPDVTFCGRLSEYKWYSMDETIRTALKLADSMIK